MISLAYVSTASTPMSDEDIAAILVQSRANNEQSGITGALLYHRGRFIQILEGPEEQVLSKYRQISVDPRHKSLHQVSREPIQVRQFPTWTMGFRTLSEKAMAQLDGFDSYFGRTGRVRIKNADPSAQLFLEWLGDYWFSSAG